MERGPGEQPGCFRSGTQKKTKNSIPELSTPAVTFRHALGAWTFCSAFLLSLQIRVIPWREWWALFFGAFHVTVLFMFYVVSLYFTRYAKRIVIIFGHFNHRLLWKEDIILIAKYVCSKQTFMYAMRVPFFSEGCSWYGYKTAWICGSFTIWQKRYVTQLKQQVRK